MSTSVSFASGSDIDTDDVSGIAAAVALAKKADITVVVTGLITCQENGAQCQEAEARDRSVIQLTYLCKWMIEDMSIFGIPKSHFLSLSMRPLS